MIYLKKTTLTVFIISLIVLLTGCGGAEERQAAYLEKAKESFEAGDYKKTKIDLRNVLQIEPKHSEATYMLGAIEEIGKNYRKSLALYSRAIEFDSNNIKARYSLGKFYLQMAKKEKAQDEIDSIEASMPGSFYAKALKAAIAFSDKKYTDAIEIVKSIKEENRNEQVYALVAASYFAIGETDKMYEMLKRGVENHQKSIELRIVLAKAYMHDKKSESVIKNFKEIISIEPDSLQYYKVLSSYYEELGDKENARKVYSDLVKNDPENTDYQLLMVQYLAAKSGEDDAKNYLEKLTKDYQGVDTYAIVLSKFEFKAGNKDESIAILENVISRKFTEKGVNAAKNFLAVISMSDGDIDKAKKLFNEVLEVSPADIDANISLGKLLLKENKPGDAVGSLRVVIRENPKNSEAYILLAKAHDLLGEKELMYDVISQGFRELPNNMNIENVYLKILMEKGKHDYAMNIITRPSSNKNLTAEGKYIRARVFFENNQLSKTETLANEIIGSDPDKDFGYILLAKIYVKQGKKIKARDVLKKGLKASNSAKLLTDFTKMKLHLGEVDGAITYLKKFSGYKPLTLTLLAELYAVKKDYVKSKAYYKQAIEISPQWDAPYISMAILQKKQGDIAGAIETYKKAVASLKDSTKLKIMLADAYQVNGRVQDSIDIYRSMIKEDPDNVIAINNLAQMLVDNYDDKTAYAEALNLVEKIKNNSNVAVLDTVAWVYYKVGNYAEAVNILKGVVEKTSDVAVFNYHLGMALYKAGDKAAAKKYLTVAVADKNSFPGKDEASDYLQKLQ